MTPILEIDAVTKNYGGLTAVDAVSTTVPRGSIFGLIGPNGAGKTTLFNCITGMVRMSAGSIRLLATDRPVGLTGLKPEAITSPIMGPSWKLKRVSTACFTYPI